MTTPDLDTVLASLDALKVAALRELWRSRFGEPPPVRSGDLLRRVLAERLQREAFGHDPDLERDLGKLTKRLRLGGRPEPVRANFLPGSQLRRDWQGVRHIVEVVDGGYIWNGQRHDSLSKIAREITGVRWNGPRFFGLREAAR